MNAATPFAPTFDLVLLVSPEAIPTVIRSAMSADEATLVFAAEVPQLQDHRVPGEVVIRYGDRDHRCVLRQPLVDDRTAAPEWWRRDPSFQ